MSDLSIDINKVAGIDPVNIASVQNIAPVTIETIKRVEKIAPAAVHIKELNNIDPLTVESLRVDSVRNLDPINVDTLNVTRLPMVNLSMARMPTMDLNIRRMPPLAIGLHQEFELPSEYTIHTRLLGFEIMRFDIHGSSRLVPREKARREQSHNHERSFPDVAAVGNPAIPNRCRETGAEAVVRPEPPLCAGPAPARGAPRGGLSVAAPQFSFSLSGAGRVGNGG
jgi:hypothetical protein